MHRFLVLVFCTVSFLCQANVSIDSIGTETRDGIDYILHEVEDNETLYTVSRKYDTPIYEIIKNNPPTEFGLEAGQIIKIPIKRKKKVIVKPPVDKTILEEIKKEKTLKNGTDERSSYNAPKLKTSPPKDFVHIVQPGETMYAISRLYEVTVIEIRNWNNLESNNLSIGQKLVINRSVQQSNEISDSTETSNIHIVKPSETLYSISKLYEVSIDQLKNWNSLTGNELSIGQEIVVGESKVRQPTDKPEVVIEQMNEVTDPNPMVADTTVVAEVIDTARYNTTPPSKTNFEEVIESGLAEKIAGTSGNRKYLALHRTAKAGTIMKVKNEMNDQEVFVRVIGPLPDTSNNKNVVIKISKAAYDSLGAIDPKFRVTVSYIP